MRALLATVLLSAAPAPVALLPVDAPDLAPDVARAAGEAVAGALPAPFRPLELDAAAVREHLAAAGPACRAELACLCAAAGLSPGQLALDVAVAPAGANAWAVDVRVVAPCDGGALDRHAELVPARVPELRRLLGEAVPALLRGRDLPRAPPADPAPPAAAPAGGPRASASS